MHTLTRRSFITSATIAGAAAGFAGALAGCTKPTVDDSGNQGEEPIVKEREYYTTQCHGCITCCPVKVYVEDGVAVKIEGHPYGDINLGSLCVKGMSQLHTAYSPRHVIYPMRRTGARGAENMAFERISWDEAIEEASENIVRIMEQYGTYSLLATTGGGGAYVGASMPPVVMASVFCTNAYEPGAAQCYLPRMTISQFMGLPGQSMADGNVAEPWKGLGSIDKEAGVKNDTEVLVLWGTQPSCSQTARAGRGMAELRAKGVKTVVVDPNFSTDASKATIHLPVRPGADAALILSWYRYIFENKLYDEEFTKFFTNLPCLIDTTTWLPVKAQELFPDFVQSTPENTPAYVCFDNKTGELKPLEFCAPENATVDPEIFWAGEVNGKQYKTAGQLYKEEAEPWTLARTEEFCWVPAARNEAAIKLYTDQLKQGKCAGIVHGVATDMEETSSQAPIGLMGLDAIMGYINKPGASQTNQGGGMMAMMMGIPADFSGTNQWGKCAPDYTQARPTSSFGGTYGYGYTIGATEEENRMISGMADPTSHAVFARLVRDRLGLTNHRGLTSWNQSHIPAVRQAMETGEPWRIRMWMEFSGNKFAMAGSAGAWYNASINNVEFVTHQYANFTSFDAELTNIFFPTEEWLEMSNVSGMGSSMKSFASVPVTHLGETVNPVRPFRRMMAAVYEKANQKLDSIVFTGTGQTIAELGLKFPFTPLAEFIAPVGDGTDDSDATEMRTAMMSKAMALGLNPETATEEDFINAVKNNPRAFSASKPDETYIYGQHLVLADDGLPMGFSTESRKVEVYCTTMVKLANTGYPYCWPEGFDTPVDKRVATWNGTYAPICNVPPQKEAPYVENAGDFIMPYDEDFPLALTSGRTVFFHHGTMRHAPFTRELYPVPFARINPETAEKYGIKDGDWIEVSSRRTQGTDYDITKRGTERSYNKEKDHTTKTAEPIHTIAYVTEMVAPNVVWMERYWNPECFDKSQTTKTGGWQECNVNVLTNAVDGNFNEAFGSYTNRGFAVNIKKSTRPDRIWVTPEEFEPFMPTSESQVDDSIGVLRENKALHNHYTDFSY